MMLSLMAWRPELSITGCVAAFDMTDAGSYTVTPGSPDTVTSLTNKVSGTAWATALLTNFPEHESAAFNGLPCLRGEVANARGIGSTEAAAVAPFDGEDQAFTVITALEPTLQDGTTDHYFAAGNSAAATWGSTEFAQSTSAGTNGRWSFHIRGDGLDSAFCTRAVATPILATHQVVTSVCHGTTASLFVGSESTPEPNAQAFNVSSRTADQVSLLGRWDSSADSFWDGRIGSHYVFNSALASANSLRVRTRLMAKHGIGSAPHLISSLRCWIDMLETASFTTSGGEVTSIINKATGVTWNTAATDFPLFTAGGLNGHDCMTGNVAAGRGLISTDAALVSAFTGTDAACTVIAVVSSDLVNATEEFFAAGNSGFASNRTWRFGQTSGSPTGKPYVGKVDDAGTNVSTASTASMGSGAHIVSYVVAGTTASIYVDSGSANPSGGSINADVTTPDRMALLCRPDNSPDGFWGGSVGTVLAFNTALSDQVRGDIEDMLAGRYGL